MSTTDFLRLEEVCMQLRMGARTFRRLLRAGQFPQPIRRGPRWVRWTQSDVDNYFARLLDNRAS